MRWKLAVVVVACVGTLGLSIACGGGNDGKDTGPNDSVTAAPAGWKAFETAAFKGIVRKEWKLSTDEELLSSVDYDAIARGTGLSPSIIDAIREAIDSGAIRDWTFVVVDRGEDFATNINLFCMDPEEYVAPAVMVQQYVGQGLKSRLAGKATLFGATTDLVFGDWPQYDTFQATAQADDCAVMITLSVVDGDTSLVDDFKRFVSDLELVE